MNQNDFKAIAKVTCGDQMGTGFLVNERTMITARHVIDDSLDTEDLEPVFIQFGNSHKILATVIFPSKAYLGIDIAILSVTEETGCNPTLPLSLDNLESGMAWEAFGFPDTQKDRGQPFKGHISQVDVTCMQETDGDLDLICDSPQITDPEFITKGASGSPIVVNNAIVGVMKDMAPGGIIGATSIKRCLSILKLLQISIAVRDTSYIKRESISARSLDNMSMIDNQFDSEKETVINLIKCFPEETHPILIESLNQTIENILKTNTDKFRVFLQRYRHPFNNIGVESPGVDELVELITILRCGFKEIDFIHNDINANLSLDESEEIFTYLIFSTKKHVRMPELVLELIRDKVSTPTGKRELRRGDAILPFPLILDNYSNNKKSNLCRKCQKEFSFEDILIDFTKVDEQGYFQGLEHNNYKSLNETKVLCGGCIRNLHNHVNSLEELEFYVRGVTKID